MVNSFPNAGTGPKITTRLKSKVFSFGHAVVRDNVLTLYQVSEPLNWLAHLRHYETRHQQPR